jgi:hypothetical protein
MWSLSPSWRLSSSCRLRRSGLRSHLRCRDPGSPARSGLDRDDSPGLSSRASSCRRAIPERLAAAPRPGSQDPLAQLTRRRQPPAAQQAQEPLPHAVSIVPLRCPFVAAPGLGRCTSGRCTSAGTYENAGAHSTLGPPQSHVRDGSKKRVRPMSCPTYTSAPESLRCHLAQPLGQTAFWDNSHDRRTALRSRSCGPTRWLSWGTD